MSASKKEQLKKRVHFSVTVSIKLASTPYVQIRKSRRERKSKIENFATYLSGISFFPMLIKMFTPLQIVLNSSEMGTLYFGEKKDSLWMICCFS